MRVFSQQKPPLYFYHAQPRDPSRILVRFCENIQEYSTKTDIFEFNGWKYDEYTVEIPKCDNVNEYVKNHYTELKAEAMGGASAFEQLSAKFDYLSMMTGVDIPTNVVAIALDAQSPKFETVKSYFLQGLWNSEMLQNAVGRWITEEEKEDILSLWQARDNQQQVE